MLRLILPLTVLAPLALQAQASPPTMGTPPPEASQFDYLIGEWRFVATSRNPAGPGRFGGRWRAWKAFDGWGVQDEYRILDTLGVTRYLGYTTRIYRPAEGNWLLSYLDVGRGTFHKQFAEQREDGMHLWWEATGPQGPFLSRVRYYDITPTSFRWQQDRSFDGGKTWVEAFLTIEATRVAGAAPR